MTAPEQVLELKLKEIHDDDDLNVRPVDPRGESVRELAASIKTQGVLEPVVVTEVKDGKGYRLVFGFRRVAAARVAGLTTVPAIARKFTDGEILEAQLVENLQREELTPLQEARALQKVLSADDPPTQADLAKRLGKSQPWLSNRIRLLGLPEPAVHEIEKGTLSAAQGEALLQLPKEATANEVKSLLDARRVNDQNVREFKAEVQQATARINRRTKAKKARAHAKETAKFPDCPKKGCGKPGSPSVEYDGTVKDFRCSSGHYWSPKTGKLTHTYLDSQQDRGSRREPRAPPKPTLPFVPLEIAEHPGVEAIGKKLLGDIGEILDIQVRSGQNGKGIQLTLLVDGVDVSCKERRVTLFHVGEGGWPRTKGLRLAEEWEWNALQSDDKGRKKAVEIRQGMIDWLGTIRGPGRPKTSEEGTSAAEPRKPGAKKSKKPTAPPIAEEPAPSAKTPTPTAEPTPPSGAAANGQ